MTTTSAVLRKVNHPISTLRDKVQASMREAIISGHFKPGQRLVERPLCEQLGVSRTVIRETIRYLEAEGLVQIVPNRGPVVASIDWQDAQQIYAIRRVLEMSAAEACANNIDEILKNKLNTALGRLNNQRDSLSASQLYQRTSDFYEIIFLGAGHTIAWEVVQRLNARISRLRLLTLSSNNRKLSGAAHMQAISEAICQGSPEQARQAVGNHLDDVTFIAKQLLTEL